MESITTTTICVSVSLCALTIWQGQLSVVVSRPAAGAQLHEGWKLLRSPLLSDVDADDTARTLLWISKTPTVAIEQLRTYSEPLREIAGREVAGREVVGREITGREITVAYFALVADLADRVRISDEVRVFAVEDVLNEPEQFADAYVLVDAVERVRAKFEYTTIATSLVPEPFTIPELRRVYEAVWGVTLHPANFRRKVLATDGFVVGVSEENNLKGPDLYRRGVAAILHPAMLRPDTDT